MIDNYEVVADIYAPTFIYTSHPKYRYFPWFFKIKKKSGYWMYKWDGMGKKILIVSPQTYHELAKKHEAIF